MAIDINDRLSIEECVDYQGAAELLGFSYHEVRKAVDMGVLRRKKFDHDRKKYVPRWEVEAIKGMPLCTQATREYLEKLRQERMTVDDKEYNVDGTTEWIPREQVVQIVKETVEEAVLQTAESFKEMYKQALKETAQELVKVAAIPTEEFLDGLVDKGIRRWFKEAAERG